MPRVAKKKAKPAAKKTKATKATKAKAVKLKTTAIRDAYNKSQAYAYIAEHTELAKKDVVKVMDVLHNLIHRHVKKGGAGQFTLPGIAKMVVKRKPATKARKGINPFTGEPTTFKAKPARNVVKVRTLKKLKEMAE